MTSKQTVDLNRYNGEDGERQRDYTDGSRGFCLPNDMPAYAKVHRLFGDDGGLTGHTLELDAFLLGVKVFIRHDRSGSIKIFTQENDESKPQKLYQFPTKEE